MWHQWLLISNLLFQTEGQHKVKTSDCGGIKKVAKDQEVGEEEEEEEEMEEEEEDAEEEVKEEVEEEVEEVEEEKKKEETELKKEEPRVKRMSKGRRHAKPKVWGKLSIIDGWVYGTFL